MIQTTKNMDLRDTFMVQPEADSSQEKDGSNETPNMRQRNNTLT